MGVRARLAPGQLPLQGPDAPLAPAPQAVRRALSHVFDFHAFPPNSLSHRSALASICWPRTAAFLSAPHGKGLRDNLVGPVLSLRPGRRRLASRDGAAQNHAPLLALDWTRFEREVLPFRAAVGHTSPWRGVRTGGRGSLPTQSESAPGFPGSEPRRCAHALTSSPPEKRKGTRLALRLSHCVGATCVVQQTHMQHVFLPPVNSFHFLYLVYH